MNGGTGRPKHTRPSLKDELVGSTVVSQLGPLLFTLDRSCTGEDNSSPPSILKSMSE